MAETRKTKELNLLEDTPELSKKKNTGEEDSTPDHEVYNKQTSDSKKDKNKFMKKWHGSKKFRIGIIVGIVIILGLSLGLGLGFGLTGNNDNKKMSDTPLGSDFDDWINDMSNTSENDLRDLENSAIIWALDQEVAKGLINPSDASAAKEKAIKKTDREIDNEKKEQKKADEDWDDYLTGLGFDSEEEYYNSKIASAIVSTSDIVDGLTDLDDTTSKIDAKDVANYDFVSSAPKNTGSSEGKYLAVTSNSYIEGSPNTTQTLMELYLNITKPVYFQQESISYTLNSSENPGSNPNEWESMTFSDNTQIQAAYVMAWKLQNATGTGEFYDLGNTDTPIVSPTQSGVKHFSSLPSDLTSLAYYYAAVGDDENVTSIEDGLTEIGTAADKVLAPYADADGKINDGTFSDTNITESDRRDISNQVFNGPAEATNDIATTGLSGKGLSTTDLYKNGDRVLGSTIEWNSEDPNNNNANINNEYLLTADASSFTVTRMEDANYERISNTSDALGESDYTYDISAVGENMLENDLEKELNGMERSSYQGIVKYGIWDDFELWVNDNAKVLALNWALTADDSDFLTKTEFDDNDINYHIETMDELNDKVMEGGKSINKGQSLLNYFYSEFIVNENNIFDDKFIAADDFINEKDNDEIYLKFNESKNGAIKQLLNEFTYFDKNISKEKGTYILTSFNDLLADKGGDQ